MHRETRKNELEQKILNHELLTEEEIDDYRWLVTPVFEEYGDMHRWFIYKTEVYQIQNKFFKLEFGKALTELQEDVFFDCQFTEVVPQRVMVQKINWIEV